MRADPGCQTKVAATLSAPVTVLPSAMTRAFDQKISVRNPPQNATLASSTNHSEAFSEKSLPSLATMAINVGTRHGIQV